MREVGELAGVAQEDVREDLQAMFRGAIRANLEGVLAAGSARLGIATCSASPWRRRSRRRVGPSCCSS